MEKGETFPSLSLSCYVKVICFSLYLGLSLFLVAFIHLITLVCPQRVEMASEFAISEVFSLRKPQSGINRGAELLQSSEELIDHDDAYSEGRSAYREH